MICDHPDEGESQDPVMDSQNFKSNSQLCSILLIEYLLLKDETGLNNHPHIKQMSSKKLVHIDEGLLEQRNILSLMVCNKDVSHSG